jgi:hypothetical protein
MDDTALTPVERGVLFILMAHGEPLRQKDLKAGHGLTIKRHHRLKLRDLGFIEVNSKPLLTLTLTKSGWAWLEAELTAPRQARSIAPGPLYAVLGVVNRLTKRLGLPLEAALALDGAPPPPAAANAPPPAPPPATDIRPPEWIEVDELLARALQDISVFSPALSRLKDAAKGALENEIKRAGRAANLVFQNVELAARKRALNLDGAAGSEASFDPVFFHSDEDIKPGTPVRIRKSAVTRGQGKKKVIIQPGIAEAIHS